MPLRAIPHARKQHVQNLQREYLSLLYNISTTLLEHPDATSSYEDLREHLDGHCNRVYNGGYFCRPRVLLCAKRIPGGADITYSAGGRHMRMAVFAALQSGACGKEQRGEWRRGGVI